jgi:mRNA interferase MazF
MPTFKAGDVVKVPFPYVDSPHREVRPALVVSAQPLSVKFDLFWAIMITSAENEGWPGDISLGDNYRAFGLTAPSVVRTEKISTVDAVTAVLLGRLDAEKFAAVKNKLRQTLDLQ